MNKKTKALIAVGGTGGHVFPGYNLAKNLIDENYDIKLITDKRGYKFLNKLKNFEIYTLPSSPLIKKNIFTIFFSLNIFIYSILRSLIFLVLNRPKVIFGMGDMPPFLFVLLHQF